MVYFLFFFSLFGACASELESISPRANKLTLFCEWELLERAEKGDTVAVNELGLRAENREQPEEAIFWYKKGSKLCSPESCMALVRLYNARGDEAKVETYVDRTALLCNAQLSFTFAKIEIQKGSPDFPLIFLKEAADVANILEAQLMLGKYYRELGDLKAATTYYKKAVKQRSWESYIPLAGILEERGKYNQACDILEHGLAENLRYFDRGTLYFNLAQLHGRLGDRAKALFYMKLAANKNHPKALFLLGATGKVENPGEYLKKAVDAGEHRAHYYLACYYSDKEGDEIKMAEHMRLAFTHRDHLNYPQFFAVCFFLFFYNISECICNMDFFPGRD